MMIEHYKKELNLIKADERWKAQLKEKVYLEMNVSKKTEMKPISKKINVKKLSIGFACICLLLSGTIIYYHYSKNNKGTNQSILNNKWVMEMDDILQNQIYAQLPKLHLSTNEFATGGMGFEGYDFYHEDELIHLNPYNVNDDTEALPVYQNLYITGRYGMEEISRYTPKEEIELLTSYADTLNIHEYQIEERGYDTLLISDGCQIQINSKDRITFHFSEINGDDQLFINSVNTTKEQVIEQIQQLIKQPKLRGLFAFTKANIDVQMHYEYNDESQMYVPSWNIKVSEGKGSKVDQLVNNQLKAIEISNYEKGDLTIIINLDNTMKKVGNYPIMTLEEAKQNLLQGNYFTNSWGQGDIEKICYIEMVYHKNKMLDYFMPYYKFYMPLEEQEKIIKQDEKIVRYVSYYVPAIRSEYLESALKIND